MSNCQKDGACREYQLQGIAQSDSMAEAWQQMNKKDIISCSICWKLCTKDHLRAHLKKYHQEQHDKLKSDAKKSCDGCGKGAGLRSRKERPIFKIIKHFACVRDFSILG